MPIEAGPRHDVRLRPDGLPLRPPRQPAELHALRPDPPRARVRGLQVTQIMNITDVGHMTDESSAEAVDKMLLADGGRGAHARSRSPRSTRRAVFEDADGASASARPTLPEGDRAHPGDDRPHRRRSIDEGHAYVVDYGSVYYDVASFPGYGKLSGNTLDNLREGHRDLETDPRKRTRRRLRALEGRGPGPPDEVAEPVGRGVPRLAHRVLGDVDEVPRRALRHPHGRQRPAVPAPRGRDRAVRGRGGPRGRVDLGPRRPPASVGPEDREVDRQRGPRART